MPTELERLEALNEGATKAPWREEGREIMALKEKQVAEIPGPFLRAKVDDRNAALIAAARNALPDLLAVAKAAQAHVDSPGALAAPFKHEELSEALAPLLRKVEA